MPTQYESPPGYYSGSGATVALACAPGSYNNEYAQTSCPLCAAGKYSANASATSCANCPLGFYCDEGTDVPIRCPAGRYGDALKLTNATECTKCDRSWHSR